MSVDRHRGGAPLDAVPADEALLDGEAVLDEEALFDEEAMDECVAVLGLAGRFPGAADVDALWRLLVDERESLRRLTREELLADGADPALIDRPGYVPVRGVLDDVDRFDAGFFDVPPREAALSDPQHRLFLECAWAALEDAGRAAPEGRGRVGVYGGVTLSTYLLHHLLARGAAGSLEAWQIGLLNEKDALSTRVSYKLDLDGPSMTVQTACSSSLVAVHLARQALVDYECDLALAGGVTVRLPQARGHVHEPGSILSSDGAVRAFDARADGVVFGNGVGVVVLKRLADALADGDPIRAVVRSTAVNNDGAAKVGYTAPSVDGQAKVVSRALALADLEPADIGYVEAHGTGTSIGDAIEVAALRRVFGDLPPGSCVLGSVKTNVGHLDSAAGVTGLIKTVLALEHETLPASLHFESANPKLGLDGSPFEVAAQTRPWPRGEQPRRAGVSAFGIGGTNAHVILEEAPARQPSGRSREWQVLVLSARAAAPLDALGARLGDRLRGLDDDLPALADLAHTSRVGRRAFEHRRAVICRDATEAIEALEGNGGGAGTVALDRPGVVGLLTGQGAQRPGMGADLYRAEPIYRAAIDELSERFAPRLGVDLRRWLGEGSDRLDATAAADLAETRLTQPALFTVEVALARLWATWGVEPVAWLGHSIGECVAAHLAGVFDLEAAVALIAARGRAMQAAPAGAMLSVPLTAEAVTERLAAHADVVVAVENAADRTVVAGPSAAIEAFADALGADGVRSRRLATSHAFHSPSMDGVLETFRAEIAALPATAPTRPFVSNVTGTWIRPADAVDPDYWVRQIRSPVRFHDALTTVLAESGRALLEIGPGDTLAGLARRHPERDAATPVIASLGRPKDDRPEDAAVLDALGRLWCAGVDVDWHGFSTSSPAAEGDSGERRRRVAWPAYPFERQRHWIEASASEVSASEQSASEQSASEVSAAKPDPPATVDGAVGHIMAVWREVLGVEAIGARDDFFALGGDSLAALQIAGRLRDAGWSIDVAQVLEHATPAALARVAGMIEAAEPAVAEPTPDGEAPLTFAQERLWFLAQLTPDDPAYHQPMLATLDGPLDVDALRRAFETLASRHEPLRTGFALRAHGPVQIVAEQVDVPLPVEVVADEAAARRRIVEVARRPFDLGAPPLLRLSLLRLAPDRHWLLLVPHHLITDGWSNAVMIRELAALYGDPAVSGHAAPPMPATSYTAAARRERLAAADDTARRTALDTWRERLTPLPSALDLPFDRQPPALRSSRGLRLDAALDADTLAAVDRLARRRGATRFMVLGGLFQALLGHLAGATDVTLGTPVSGRRPETESLVGFFVNTVVLRLDLGGDPTVDELVDRARAAALDAFARQDVPFAQLVDHLDLPRELATSPLFQAFFALQKDPGAAVDLPSGLRVETADVDLGTAKFDLTLNLVERADGGLGGWFEIDTDRFDEATGRQLLERYVRLVAAAVATPERRLSDLPWIDAAERRRRLDEHHAALPSTPLDEPFVHRLIERRAREAPGAPAVTCGDATRTRAEVSNAAEHVAFQLRARGVAAPETVVAVGVERSADLPALLLGIWRAGAAYVPLDPAHPAERLAQMLEDSGASVLIADPVAPTIAAAADAAGFRGVRVTPTDLLTDDDVLIDRTELVPPADGEQLAYVLFTSGSTGRPKGVEVPHRALANFLGSMARRPGLDAEDVLAAVTTLGFDISALELFLPLLVGARVDIVPRDVASDGPSLRDRLASIGATALQATPTTWRLLLAAGWRPPAGFRVLCGGEALPPDLAEALLSESPDGARGDLWNLYGPTETTVWSATARIEPDAPIVLGSPIERTRLVELGPDGRWRAEGAVAELAIGGDGVARGYRGQPGRTAEVFVPDPFAGAERPGARLYRTGDLVRRGRDGSLHYLGRRDQQVKVRGFRIEIGEVEAALSRDAAIEAAAVGVRPGPAGDARLVAWVVPTDEASVPDAADLRERLRRALPDYMLPAVVVPIDALPTNASGKIDRRALPDPEPGSRRLAAERTPPRDATEATLATIWAAVLGVDEVGIDDNFFDLGGDSIASVQVVARAAEAGLDLVTRDLFEAQTIAHLARRAGTPADPDPAGATVDPAERAYWQDQATRLRDLATARRSSLAIGSGTPPARVDVVLGDASSARLRSLDDPVSAVITAVAHVEAERTGEAVSTVLVERSEPATSFPLVVDLGDAWEPAEEWAAVERALRAVPNGGHGWATFDPPLDAPTPPIRVRVGGAVTPPAETVTIDLDLASATDSTTGPSAAPARLRVTAPVDPAALADWLAAVHESLESLALEATTGTAPTVATGVAETDIATLIARLGDG